jgi:hypothetical protein
MRYHGTPTSLLAFIPYVIKTVTRKYNEINGSRLLIFSSVKNIARYVMERSIGQATGMGLDKLSPSRL